MKHLPILLAILTLISCSSVEDRIKEHSYTNEWYYMNAERYQVYKTATGTRYIIVLNEKQTKFKRKYIKR